MAPLLPLSLFLFWASTAAIPRVEDGRFLVMQMVRYDLVFYLLGKTAGQKNNPHRLQVFLYPIAAHDDTPQSSLFLKGLSLNCVWVAGNDQGWRLQKIDTKGGFSELAFVIVLYP